MKVLRKQLRTSKKERGVEREGERERIKIEREIWKEEGDVKLKPLHTNRFSHCGNFRL